MKKMRKLFRRLMAGLLIPVYFVGMLLLAVPAAQAESVSSSIKLDGLVSNAYNSEGIIYSALDDSIAYEMLSGDFFGGTVTPLAKTSDKVMGDVAGGVFIQSGLFSETGQGQLGVKTGQDVLFKFVAQQNLQLTVEHDATMDLVGSNGGANKSAFYYVTENAEGKRVTVKEIPVTGFMNASLFTHTVHLRVGDTFYVVYHLTASATVMCRYYPKLTVDTEAYDASLRTDYNKSIKLDELVSNAYNTEGTIYSALDDSIAYEMLSGDFFGGTVTPIAKTSDKIMGSVSGGVFIQSGLFSETGQGQLGVKTGQDVLFKFVAQQNMQLTVEHDATMDLVGSNGGANKSVFYYVTENAEGKRVTVKEIPVTGFMNASLFTHTVHLCAGDTFYVVYHLTASATVMCRYYPKLTVDTEAYDASQRTDYNKSIKLDELVSNAYNTEGTTYSALNDSMAYELLSGDFFGGTVTALAKTSDTVMGDVSGGVFIRTATGQLGVKTGQDVLFKFVAQQNMELTVEHDATMDLVGSNGGANKSAFYYVTENAEGKRVTVKEIPVTGFMDADLFTHTVHLRAGDTFYVVYHLTASATVMCRYYPKVTVDTEAYDATARTDYSDSVILDELISNAYNTEKTTYSVLDGSIVYEMLSGDFFGGTLTALAPASESVMGDVSGGVFIRTATGQLGVKTGQDVLFKFVAQQNMELTVEHDVAKDLVGSYGGTNKSVFYYIVENTDGASVTVRMIPVTGLGMEAALFGQTVHLQAGDTFYIVYHFTASGSVQCRYYPRIKVNTETYDAGQRVDFTQTSADPAICTHSYISTVITPAGTFMEGLAMKHCSLCGYVCTESVPATKALKILTIGNSCTDNSSYYLWEIPNDLGVETVVVGNAQIGGTSLDDHWNQISSNAASYIYRKSTSGKWVYSSENVGLLDALTDEAWDIITVNSRIGYSGMSDKFGNLDNILNWLNANKTNTYAKIMYIMPWACPEGSSYADFPSYNNDQLAMFEAIADVTQNVVAVNSGIAQILPVGTAIQNARTSAVGDNLDIDGIHLNSLGKYIAGLTIAGEILGVDLNEITWAPKSVSADCVTVSVESAANAIANPYEITNSQITGDINLIPSGNLVFNNGTLDGILAENETERTLNSDWTQTYPVATWGSTDGDSPAKIKNVDGNNVIALEYSSGNFASFFADLYDEGDNLPAGIYRLSMDLLPVGEDFQTNNVGFNLYNQYTDVRIYSGGWQNCTLLENGWLHFEAVFEINADSVDSIQFWFNTMGSSVLYVDNLSICDASIDKNPVGSVKEWGLTLGGSISAEFIMEVSSDTVDVEVTVNGTTKRYSGVSDGETVVVELAAAQMTDEIHIKLIDSQGNESGQLCYTVRQYCDQILSGDYSDSTKTLVRAMLGYGAKAQLYFGYNTSVLADEGIDIPTAQVPTEKENTIVTGSVSGVKYYGATLVHQSYTAVRFYFAISDEAQHTFTNGDGSVTYTPVEKNGMYYVEIADMGPAALDDSFTVCVDNSMTVNYGPMDYIIRMYNRGASSDVLKAVLLAMYTYWESAEAYTASSNQ